MILSGGAAVRRNGLMAMKGGWIPGHAMVLAAGLGQRMRPITDTLPKPLVRIGGKAMLDHALDRLAAIGVGHAVVNVHHLADQIERHLARRTRPAITISDERAMLLETGGGVTKALPHLGRDAFFHLNSDSLWVERGVSNLQLLAQAWEPARMDMLLMLADRSVAMGYDGAGDFLRAEDGALARRPAGGQVPHIYAGVAIMKPSLLDGAPTGKWSLNRLFDRLIAERRLYGQPMQGQWLHVGTPDAIPEADARLAAAAREQA
jgi:N-acetyl-alpha-D-muramate 1-phosphate uridylyltransferase